MLAISCTLSILEFVASSCAEAVDASRCRDVRGPHALERVCPDRGIGADQGSAQERLGALCGVVPVLREDLAGAVRVLLDVGLPPSVTADPGLADVVRLEVG